MDAGLLSDTKLYTWCPKKTNFSTTINSTNGRFWYTLYIKIIINFDSYMSLSDQVWPGLFYVQRLLLKQVMNRLSVAGAVIIKYLLRFFKPLKCGHT